MIQRVQTIYLLLAGILSAIGFCVCSAGWGTDGAVLVSIDYVSVTDAAGQVVGRPWGVLVFGLMATAMPVVAIFGYKDRKRQMRQARLAQLFMLLVYPTLYAYASAVCRHLPELPSGESAVPSFIPCIGLVFPLLACIFAGLAHRAIRKDEELVRAADRVR